MRSKRSALAITILVFAGLGCSEDVDSTPTAAQPQTEPKQGNPADDSGKPDVNSEAELTDFQKSVSTYIGEARSGAKLWEINPTQQQMKEKSDLILDLYTRIPEVPPETPSSQEVATKLKRISDVFRISLVFEDLTAQLGTQEALDEREQERAKEAKEIRGHAAFIESAVLRNEE